MEAEVVGEEEEEGVAVGRQEKSLMTMRRLLQKSRLNLCQLLQLRHQQVQRRPWTKPL